MEETSKIIIEPAVEHYITKLIEILYVDEYFSFFESSLDYADEIISFIYTIPKLKSKPTFNNRFGNYYCTYKVSYSTSWYIVFDIEDNVYLVKFITNNHSNDYPTYIRG